MVGLIHRGLLSLVESAAGSDAVPEVRRRADVPENKQFRIDEAYDDAEWQRLLAAACQVLSVTQGQAEQATPEETRCLKKGDPECEIHIRWAEPGGC
jgi:hypothetical protein